jgi:hypothetical protein
VSLQPRYCSALVSLQIQLQRPGLTTNTTAAPWSHYKYNCSALVSLQIQLQRPGLTTNPTAAPWSHHKSNCSALVSPQIQLQRPGLTTNPTAAPWSHYKSYHIYRLSTPPPCPGASIHFRTHKNLPQFHLPHSQPAVHITRRSIFIQRQQSSIQQLTRRSRHSVYVTAQRNLTKRS